MKQMNGRRVDAILMSGVALLAMALRVYLLDGQSFWSDEGISLLRSAQPFGEMMRNMPVEHVPGYFVLLFGWLRAAGTSDYALRFLSMMPSVLSVAMIYRLAIDLGFKSSPHQHVRATGLAAALLLATGAFQIWYAQEVRMYAWLLLTEPSLGLVSLAAASATG